MITDDDDNTIGYVELTLDSSLWVNQIGELTTNEVMLYDLKRHRVSLATNDALAEKLLASLPEDLQNQSFVQTQSQETNFLTDILPIRGANDSTIGLLLVISDATAFMKAEQKRWVFGLSITLAIVLLSQIDRPWARVYVPEPFRAGMKPGKDYQLKIDGLPQTFNATLRSISSEASFTPYFALTEKDRSRLVYVAELDIQGEAATALTAGTPVQLLLNNP